MQIVHGARQQDYGHPSRDFARSAALITALLGHKLLEPITAEDVGLIQICIKLSRQMNCKKRDNLVDIAGYAETVNMVLMSPRPVPAGEVSLTTKSATGRFE